MASDPTRTVVDTEVAVDSHSDGGNLGSKRKMRVVGPSSSLRAQEKIAFLSVAIISTTTTSTTQKLLRSSYVQHCAKFFTCNISIKYTKTAHSIFTNTLLSLLFQFYRGANSN